LQAIKAGRPSHNEGRPLFWLFRGRWAVLSGDWKLVKTSGPGGPPAHQILYSGDSAEPKPALFNLKSDPAEQHDVSGQHPAVVKRLTRMFEDWRQQTRTEALSGRGSSAPPKR
jgi:hypothetical protein